MDYLRRASAPWFALRRLMLVAVLSIECGCQSVRLATILWPKDEATVIIASFGTPAPVGDEGREGGLRDSIRLTGAADESANLIDLGIALRLAGLDNPTIRLAEEQVREAFAGQLAARAMALPTFNVGGSYRAHQGALQDDPGFLRYPRSQSLYLGAGAGTVGAGNMPIPGVWLFTHLGDAAYAPLAAQQRVVVRQSDAIAVRNTVLLDVAIAYMELAGAEAQMEVLRRAENEVAEIARLTGLFAKAGQGNPSDANRALANTELVRRQMREADGNIHAASARLCRLLSLDPTIQLRTPNGSIAPLRFVSEDAELEEFVAIAVRSRPELRARGAAIQEAQIRVRQERVRPLLPLVGVGYSAGTFGGGSDQVAQTFGPLEKRSDFTVLAVWNMQGLGMGNQARVTQAAAVAGQSVADYDLALNQVRREVGESLATCRAAVRQMDAARSALLAAEEGFRLEADRTKLGQGVPIETLDSFRQLLDARRDVIRAVLTFDVAQLRLFVALGSDPEMGLHSE